MAFPAFCVLLLLAFVHPEEEPFLGIRKAEASFDGLERSFAKYRKALDACAPQYDATVPAGPPFDMYHNLELLHRMLSNFTAWMRDAQELWKDLQMS
jgi:hypothetical protein